MFSIQKKTYGRERGFTLVETLVAITIFVLVIISPMTIASRGLRSAFFANEQTTAVFLAQEGLESIIGLRDEEALDVLYDGGSDSWAWFGALESSCKNDAIGCDFDIDSGDYVSCSPADECRIEVFGLPNTGNEQYYGHGNGSNWSDTIYTRQIFLEETDPGKVLVTVNVSWETGLFGAGNTRVVTLQTWLMDHYDRYE